MRGRIVVLLLAVMAAACGKVEMVASDGGVGGGGSQMTSDGGSIATSCLTGALCAVDPDCQMAERCNHALTPPQCQKLYCGPAGSACDHKDELCQPGLYCAQGAT